MLGDRECLCEVHDPRKVGALKPGADGRLEYGEGLEVSVPGLEEEVFKGRGLASSHRLSRGWSGRGSGRVGRDGGDVFRKSCLYNRLEDGVDVHVWR